MRSTTVQLTIISMCFGAVHVLTDIPEELPSAQTHRLGKSRGLIPFLKGFKLGNHLHHGLLPAAWILQNTKILRATLQLELYPPQYGFNTGLPHPQYPFDCPGCPYGGGHHPPQGFPNVPFNDVTSKPPQIDEPPTKLKSNELSDVETVAIELIDASKTAERMIRHTTQLKSPEIDEMGISDNNDTTIDSNDKDEVDDHLITATPSESLTIAESTTTVTSIPMPDYNSDGEGTNDITSVQFTSTDQPLATCETPTLILPTFWPYFQPSPPDLLQDRANQFFPIIPVVEDKNAISGGGY